MYTYKIYVRIYDTERGAINMYLYMTHGTAQYVFIHGVNQYVFIPDAGHGAINMTQMNM